jgi:hypothetical protein
MDLVVWNAYMFALSRVDEENGEDSYFQPDAIKHNWCFTSLSRIRPHKGFCYIYLIIDRLEISKTSFQASNRKTSPGILTAWWRITPTR